MRKPISDATRAKMRAAALRRGPAWREKMALVWASEAKRAKQSTCARTQRHSQATKDHLRERAKARHVAHPEKWDTGPHTAETRRKMSDIAKGRGESHNFWTDGKGYERMGERRAAIAGVEYRLWREAVFTRDDYTCQTCGVRGGVLEADHVKSWRDHPEARLDVGNGRTLCKPCHRATPTFGWRTANRRRDIDTA